MSKRAIGMIKGKPINTKADIDDVNITCDILSTSRIKASNIPIIDEIISCYNRYIIKAENKKRIRRIYLRRYR